MPRVILQPEINTVSHVSGTARFRTNRTTTGVTNWDKYVFSDMPEDDPILKGDVYCSLVRCETPNVKLFSAGVAKSKGLDNWYVAGHLTAKQLDQIKRWVG